MLLLLERCSFKPSASVATAGAKRTTGRAPRSEERVCCSAPVCSAPAGAASVAASSHAPVAEEEAPVAEAEGLRLHLSSAAATGYKGVLKHASGRLPYSVRYGGTKVCLGNFGTAVEAAVAYARAVEEAAAKATAAAAATAGAVAAGAEPAGAEPAGAEQLARSSDRGARPVVRFEATPAYLPANAAKPKASSIMRRCGTCPACRAPDCGVCKECRDKPKFGGAGIRKKPCIGRICQQTSARREQLAPPAFAGAYAMKQTSSPLVAMPAAAYAMQQTSSPSPALAPLIKLGYIRMVIMALPYTIVLTIVGFLFQ